MATAKKLPSGSWRCLVYDYTDDNGKRKYKSFTCDDATRKGKAMAEQMATKYLLEKGESKKLINTNKKLFKDALNEYIKIKEPVLSPSTIRGYKNINGVIQKNYNDFYNIDIYKLKQEHVQNLINDLSKTKSPKTIRNYHALISAVINYYKIDLTLYTTMPQNVKPNLYIPSDDEIKKLINSVKGKEIEVPVLLAAFGCMRRGEICGLSINDIDENIIHIHHSLVADYDNNFHLKAPKTISGDRYVEVPQFVIDKIKQKGYITNIQPHSITISFEKLLKKNNIQHFRFHDLRHYSASIQHALGIPDAYIMQRGGWGSDRVLKEVYRHAMNDRQKEMSDKINSHFEELCNT